MLGFKPVRKLSCRALNREPGKRRRDSYPQLVFRIPLKPVVEDSTPKGGESDASVKSVGSTLRSTPSYLKIKVTQLTEFTNISKEISGKSFQAVPNFDKISKETAERSLFQGHRFKDYIMYLSKVNNLLSNAVNSLREKSNQANLFSDRVVGNEIVEIFKGSGETIQNITQLNSILLKITSDRLNWIRVIDIDKLGSKPYKLKSGELFTVDGLTSYRFVNGIPVVVERK